MLWLYSVNYLEPRPLIIAECFFLKDKVEHYNIRI